jgi:PAS domain S-box-containing protein
MSNGNRSGPSKWTMIGLFGVMAIILTAGGYWFYRNQVENVRKEGYKDLKVIAELKLNQIIQWRNQKIADAKLNSKAPFLRSTVQQWLKKPGDDILKTGILNRLKLIKESAGYENVILAGPDSRILFSLDPRLVVFEGRTKQLIDRTASTREVVFDDFFRCTTCTQVHLDVAAPILDQTGKPLAVLILRTDPEKFLYPLIQSWPTSSKSAETLIVRREGKDVLFLNVLRHLPDPALTLRIPLSQTGLPAVMVVGGKTGIFEGRDYRKVEVLNDLRPIPDTPWFLVAKIDKKEFLEEAAERARLIGFLTLALVVLSGAGTAYWYKHQGKRVYQALYRSERERTNLLDQARVTLYSIGDAVITTGSDGRVRQMNPVAEELTGWKEPEAVGRPLSEVFHVINEETREEVRNPVERILKDGQVVGLANHTLLISKEGTEHPIANSGAPIHNKAGEIIGVVLVFRDQTEERNHIHQLQETEAFLKKEKYFSESIINSLPGVFYLFDQNGKFLRWNKNLEVVTGRSAEEISRISPLDLFEGPEKNLVAQRIQEVFVTGGSDVEAHLISKDGTLTPYYFTGVRVVLDGQICLTGVGHDVSERLRAEAALKLSEERYRTILDETGDGYFEMDVGGHFTLVNDSLCRILGYSREELLGMSYKVYIPPEEVEMVFQAYNRIYRTGEPARNYNLRVIRKDGSIGLAETSGFAIRNERGEVIGFRGIRRDITERKKAEEEREKMAEQLQQAQKMESIGRLAGGVAHDFNNLLTAIIGNVELALMDEKQTEALQERLEDVRLASEKAAMLTQQLLAFSRKQVLQPKIINLNNIVLDVKKMLGRLIGEDIEIQTFLAPDLGQVEADPGQLEHVIINLAVNARDALPNGGRFTIETVNIELDESYAAGHLGVMPGSYVMLSVSDNGIGMSPDVRAQIFDPFFTTKEKGKGTGLGLSTVYGIVKQSKGNVWVYSEEGRGTTFKIYLPRVDKEAVEEKKKELPGEVRSGTETILVVEDDESLRHLVVDVLQRYGYTVLSAKDGPEALALYTNAEAPIHLLLTDVIIPGMNGKELAERLAEIQPNLQTLFMSGYTDNAIVHHGILDKGIAFLQKPFTPEVLARKIREVLDL